MRLLHTGDWHVGRAIRGRSRADEFEKALAQVVEIARAEEVDGVLVSGDVFDQRSMSAESEMLVFSTLIDLHAHRIPVVMIPGNHDVAPRFDALGELLSFVDCSVVARVRKPDRGGVVTIPARDSSHAAKVSCVPFVPARRFSDAASEFDDVATGYVNYDEGIGNLLARYEQAFAHDHVNVVLAHAFVAGAVQAGSEREVTVGREYAVSPTRLPGTATYVALGHIHIPQRVPGAPCEARYSGSLIQLDFGERGQEKSVAIVDAVPGKPPKVTEIPIDAGRDLVDLEGTLDDLPRLAEKIGDAYARVNLHVDAPVPGLAEQVRSIMPNALDVRLVLPERDEGEATPSLRALGPREQFVDYHRKAHGADPGEDLLAAFDRVYEEVEAS